MIEEKKLNAIIYCSIPQPVTGRQFLKYHIANKPGEIEKFKKFAAKFPGAWYINLYYQGSRKFKERIYLTTEKPR